MAAAGAADVFDPRFNTGALRLRQLRARAAALARASRPMLPAPNAVSVCWR